MISLFAGRCGRWAVVWLACAVTVSNAAWPFKDKKDGDAGATGARPASVQAPAPAPAAGVLNINGEVVTNGAGKFVLRQHLKLEGKPEADFKALLTARVQVGSDLDTLRRLSDEKQRQQALIAGQLRNDFGIDEKANYEFNADSGTIFEIVAAPAGGPTNATAGRREFRKLPKKEQQELFVRLVAARRVVADEVRVLAQLQGEKAAELQTVQNNLNRNYSISNDRGYTYDAATHTLYELVPVPASASGTAASATGGEAVRAK